jgi:hypothetical protein
MHLNLSIASSQPEQREVCVEASESLGNDVCVSVGGAGRDKAMRKGKL